MVGRSDGFFVLYPVYFDSRATRAQGRRVTAAVSAPGPSAKDVFEAAKAAGLDPVLEDERHHPSAWFERGGRVLIPEGSAGSKRDAIARVGAGIRRVVEARPEGPRVRRDRPRKGRFSQKRRRRRHR
ncbi:MAG TPA: signal recognition particle subunit SRP19/SEC65 family protein [Candidatus Thermoplasmatota archaeon]